MRIRPGKTKTKLDGCDSRLILKGRRVIGMHACMDMLTGLLLRYIEVSPGSEDDVVDVWGRTFSTMRNNAYNK